MNTEFEEFVVAPQNTEEAETHMHEMIQAGFIGCCGSSDATHVLMDKCTHRLRQAHTSFKLQGAARSYNITVNHRRRILFSTNGHPSRWNDKTLVLFDDFMRGIHNGTVLDDVVFELYERDIDGATRAVKYKGAWLLVDNGYLSWATTIPPFKNTSSRAEIRWSQWLESMRKDVECTFGILKGRWRILKAGVRLHGVEACDKVWKTCCALHNMLLEVDGLDEHWQEGVESDWQGELGQHDEEDFINYAPPFAVCRLHSPTARRNFDASSLEVEEDQENGELATNEELIARGTTSNDPTPDANGCRVVRKLSQEYFRSKLVEHFDILFHQGKIVWPKRAGKKQPDWVEGL